MTRLQNVMNAKVEIIIFFARNLNVSRARKCSSHPPDEEADASKRLDYFI